MLTPRQRLSTWLFRRTVLSNLVYNQCWEDPELDRLAAGIGPGDRMLMITSAGCNALNYLVDDPERIDCVDLNPNQTALLELKLAALRCLTQEQFFAMFGDGRIAGHESVYARLRRHISVPSRRIWDRRIGYFAASGPGLYMCGSAGAFARWMNWYIDRRPPLRDNLAELARFADIRQQEAFYREKVAPLLWSPLLRWLVGQQWLLNFLGVPADQVSQMRDYGVNSISDFVEQRLDHVFSRVHFGGNYFWQVYLNGQYTTDCCPPYLRSANFDLLRGSVDRIRPHTASITDHLAHAERKYTIFVLLDHMDWMRGRPDDLREEWQWILARAEPGARIIFRSGATAFQVPDFVEQQLQFHHEVSRALHQQDRVGTYGSFYLATVSG